VVSHSPSLILCLVCRFFEWLFYFFTFTRYLEMPCSISLISLSVMSRSASATRDSYKWSWTLIERWLREIHVSFYRQGFYASRKLVEFNQLFSRPWKVMETNGLWSWTIVAFKWRFSCWSLCIGFMAILPGEHVSLDSPYILFNTIPSIMSYSDRRSDGVEGRGVMVEEKYIPWGIIGAEILRP